MWTARRRLCAPSPKLDRRGGTREKKNTELFRWGMGGGYGRPFFMAMAQSKKFPAVTIAAPSRCCEAVNALEGVRILAVDAPTLPMPTCTIPNQCRCRFQKYVDRREDEQGRRSVLGQERAAWYAGGQRRKSRGRRPID
jgi:hypothetical protein